MAASYPVLKVIWMGNPVKIEVPGEDHRGILMSHGGVLYGHFARSADIF